MFRLEEIPGATVLHVSGEVDFNVVAEFEGVLDRAAQSDAERVVVSFADALYVDSSIITTLIQHRRTLRSRLKTVIPAGSRVRRIFAILSLLESLEVADTLEDALAQPVVDGPLP